MSGCARYSTTTRHRTRRSILGGDRNRSGRLRAIRAEGKGLDISFTGARKPESRGGAGFATARRGYRPEQVDRLLAELEDEGRAAEERIARLERLAGELAAEAERLQQVVASLAPPAFETLGARARLILTEAEEASAELRRSVDAEVAAVHEEAAA
ncbi:DivIVA domain-containing protein, partial [Streptomyces sparsus]